MLLQTSLYFPYHFRTQNNRTLPDWKASSWSTSSHHWTVVSCEFCRSSGMSFSGSLGSTLDGWVLISLVFRCKWRDGDSLGSFLAEEWVEFWCKQCTCLVLSGSWPKVFICQYSSTHQRICTRFRTFVCTFWSIKLLSLQYRHRKLYD